MRSTSTITTPDGITWYFEQEGTGPHIVLIPDGLGDCHMFKKPLSLIANSGFTVTTFDNPGLSRSSNAPPETYQNFTPHKLAGQVFSLLDNLHIDIATFWGCSSGGAVVLALADNYPERVRNGMPHEVPTYAFKALLDLLEEDNMTISSKMKDFVPSGLVGNVSARDALGPDCHARLWKNYRRFIREYVSTFSRSSPIRLEGLRKRPLDWSVGAKTPTAAFLDNIVVATRAGVGVTALSGMHYPYVTDFEEFARYVVDTTRKYL
ncbi:zearalenone hydrolase [Pseudomassariella vexata]|uniref:Zearalenone hydrolase n=1 Tax=Pseudomassariella vexata TaxID=1141098 RepID=A0A1Y2EKN6_9PEZI|nr:zearalenone hydrolase [Pseudomassariella vexata]ORY72098.1 zearalenone hydrolase [Pseudomassariella vexata]